MKFLTRITSVLLVVLISAAALAGCGKKGNKIADPVADKDGNITLLIGGIGALTGDYAVYGEAVRNGAQLAVDEINAAGGVNEGYRPGDIMVISDHIKLNGASPMRGKNLPEFGDRFFDVSRMYTPRLRELALRLAKGTKLRVHEGVYFFMPGPQFETPAEIRAIRLLGGDAVGMSTVTEALTAAHCGLELLGFSVITNMAAGMLDQPLTTEEVSETGRMIEQQFSTYLKSIIREMH